MLRIAPNRPSFLQAFLGEAGVGERILAWTGMLLLTFLMAVSLFTIL